MIIYTKHAVARMLQRDILRSEVKRVLAKGHIVTDHNGENEYIGQNGEFKVQFNDFVVIAITTEGDDIVILTTWRL